MKYLGVEPFLRRVELKVSVETGVGTTTYAYDAAGHLSSLTNAFTETTAFTYDNGGRLTRKTLLPALTTHMGMTREIA